MTTNENSITIVVAALNEEHQLEDAVTTVVEAAERWFDEYEVLVYNDGSTDRTGEVADRLADRYEHVTAFHHDQPKCIGGVIRAGFAQARMHYAMWVDGKGATTADVLDRIYEKKGEADIVVPFPTNQHERTLIRRAISRCLVVLLNTMFRLKLNYYTHCILFKTADTRRFDVATDSYAHQAETLIKLLKSGCTYTQVGVEDNYEFEGPRTKAFKPKNVFGIFRFLLGTFSDVYIRRICRSPQRQAEQGVAMKPHLDLASGKTVTK